MVVAYCFKEYPLVVGQGKSGMKWIVVKDQ